MPVTGVYEWDENAETLVVRVPLKGVVRSTVDVFVSDVLVKVNYAPYLLVLDLLHPVDDTGSKAVFQDGSLVLSLPKVRATGPAFTVMLCYPQGMQMPLRVCCASPITGRALSCAAACGRVAWL